jgi:hypothetical protein
LWFGKNKGRTVGELVETGAGRGYLRWVVATVKGNAATAAAIALGELDPVDVSRGGRG